MICGGDDSIEPWALALWRGHVRGLAGTALQAYAREGASFSAAFTWSQNSLSSWVESW